MEELMIVNPRRKRKKTYRRRSTGKKRYRRRRAAPAAGFVANPRRRRRRSYRRRYYRRNPKFLGGGGMNVKQILEVTAGGMSARFVGAQISRMISIPDTGLFGYLKDLASGFVVSKAARMLFKSASTERNMMLGVYVSIASKFVDDVVSGTSLIGSSRMGALRTMLPASARPRLNYAGAGSRFGTARSRF